MSSLDGLFRADRLIWILTATLYACFSIANTNPTWSSLSLLLITGFVAIITATKYGINNIVINSFQTNIIVFAIYCFISTLWAIDPSDAIERGITVVEICVCMTVFLWAYSNMQNPFYRLLKAVMYGGYAVTIYTFIFIGIKNILFMVALGGRLDSTFDNVNTIGLICAISLILSVFFLYQKKNWLLVLLDIPTLVLLSACGSRKALLVTIIGCFAIYIFRHRTVNKIAFVFKIIISIVFLFIILRLLLSLSIFSGISERMEGLLAMVTGNGEIDHSAQVRQDMFKLGISIFKDNPIFGIGMGNAHIYTLKYIGHDCYLHNNYAELLANGGVVGTYLFYRIYLSVIKKLKRNHRLKTQEGVMILILMFCLLVSDLSVVSYYSKLTYFFFMIFYVYNTQKEKSV